MEENYREVNMLIEIQTKEKLEESETIWREKLAEQEKQSEAILKELELEKNIIKTELADMVKEKNAIEEKYEKIIKNYDELNLKYTTLEEKEKNCYEDLLKKFHELEAENEINKRLVEEQRILIGPFKEQLEAYELEKEALLGENRCIEKEARDISKKYADILGHQNQKQKIKHMKDLKEKNFSLLQSNMELEKKLKVQAKTAEKLKKENEDLKKCLKKFKAPTNTDKENIGSPNRSLTPLQIHSPGPLRERN